MQTTQHAPTPCQVFMHPACTNADRPFEVRRLARDAGVAFISITRRQIRAACRPSNGPHGGDAA